MKRLRQAHPDSWEFLTCNWCGTKGPYHHNGAESVECQAPLCKRWFKVADGRSKTERSEPEPEENGRIDSIEERLLRAENEVKEHDRDLIALKLLKTWLAGWLMLIGGAIIAVLIERFLK